MPEPNPELLRKAQDDRTRRPWRYYKLDWPDAQRMLDQLLEATEAAEARLRAVEQERDELVSRLSGWRSWVPFVFGNGGYAHGSDDDLRRQVCERYDAVERAARSVVEQFRAMQRQQYEKLVLGQTLESASDNWPTLGASIDFQPLLDLFPDPPAAPPRT